MTRERGKNLVSDPRPAHIKGSDFADLGVAPPVDPAFLVAQVAMAVRNLSHRDREIVMLYAWEDLPRDDRAEITGMTRSALDQRIHRSYQRLPRVLEPLIKPIPSPPVAEEGAIDTRSDRSPGPQGNPLPDLNALEPVDVPVLTTPLERRIEMQTDDRVLVEGNGLSGRRDLVIGIATAAVILLSGLVYLLTKDDAPVAVPAPNATQLVGDS